MIERSVMLFALSVAACDVSMPERFHPAGPGHCPLIFAGDASPLIDNTCASIRCTVSVLEGGCSIGIDLDTCEQSSLSGIVEDDGTIDLNHSLRLGTCHIVDRPSEAYFSAICERPGEVCRLDLYPGKNHPFADRRTFSLFDVTFEAGVGSEHEPLNGNFSQLRGYISGAARGKNLLFVSTFDKRFDGIDCTSELATRAFVFSLPELALSSTATTPPCLTRIVSDPIGGGFIGVIGGEEPKLARFDTSAAQVGAAVPISSSTTTRTWVVDLKVDPDRQLLYVLWTSDETGIPAGVIAVHDLATLTQLGTTFASQSHFLAMDYTSNGDLAVASRDDRTIEFFAAQSLGYQGSYILGGVPTRALSDQIGAITLHKTSGFLVAPVVGMRTGLWMIATPNGRQAQLVSTALDYEAGGTVGALALYRKNVDWMIAGLTEGTPMFRARVARLDPSAGRFIPGSVEVGRGAISAIVPIDNTDDFVVVLPWSAELVRLTVE